MPSNSTQDGGKDNGRHLQGLLYRLILNSYLCLNAVFRQLRWRVPAAVGAVAADSDVCVAAVACCSTAAWRGPSGLVVAKGVTPAGGAGVALARCCRTGRCAGAHRCGAASGPSAFRRAARAAAVSPVLPACRLGVAHTGLFVPFLRHVSLIFVYAALIVLI